jgi:hypothetical protein
MRKRNKIYTCIVGRNTFKKGKCPYDNTEEGADLMYRCFAPGYRYSYKIITLVLFILLIILLTNSPSVCINNDEFAGNEDDDEK